MRFLFLIMNIFLLYSLSFAQQSELVMEKCFPVMDSAVEEDFLVQPFDVIYSDGKYYVADPRDDCVKVFSEKGVIIRRIGQKGQGPGDLSRPYRIALDAENQILYCAERGNSRISIFKTDGSFVKIIRSYIPPNCVEYINGNIYTSSYNTSDKTLFTSYDTSGVLLKNFGSFFDDRVNEIKLSYIFYNGSFLISDNRYLYAFYNYFPVIDKFDVDGNLLKRIKINDEKINDRYEKNLQEAKKGFVGGSLYVSQWMDGFYVESDTFYCNSIVHSKGIIVINYDGDVIRNIPLKIKPGEKIHPLFRQKYNDRYIFINLRLAQIMVYKEVRIN